LARQRQAQACYFEQKEANKKEELDLKRGKVLEKAKKASLKTIRPQIKQKLKEKNK